MVCKEDAAWMVQALEDHTVSSCRTEKKGYFITYQTLEKIFAIKVSSRS